MARPTMLAVEDNPDQLELTLSTLEDSDSTHSIALATNGREALDYLFGRRGLFRALHQWATRVGVT